VTKFKVILARGGLIVAGLRWLFLAGYKLVVASSAFFTGKKYIQNHSILYILILSEF